MSWHHYSGYSILHLRDEPYYELTRIYIRPNLKEIKETLEKILSLILEARTCEDDKISRTIYGIMCRQEQLERPLYGLIALATSTFHSAVKDKEKATLFRKLLKASKKSIPLLRKAHKGDRTVLDEVYNIFDDILEEVTSLTYLI
jgi:hypothetical protein